MDDSKNLETAYEQAIMLEKTALEQAKNLLNKVEKLIINNNYPAAFLLLKVEIYQYIGKQTLYTLLKKYHASLLTHITILSNCVARIIDEVDNAQGTLSTALLDIEQREKTFEITSEE